MNRYFSKHKFSALFAILTHPLQGFYEIRHRSMGSVPLAILMILLFGMTYSFNRAAASFVVSDVNPQWVNMPRECGAVLLLFLLFAIGNWSVTCLMEGEGRFSDILTVTGYALLPLVLTWIPATFLSWIIAANEQTFYLIFIWFGVIWSVFLFFTGIMTVHAFSLAKTLATLFFTAISIFIIIFISVMLVNLLNQVYMFFRSVYTEVIFRF